MRPANAAGPVIVGGSFAFAADETAADYDRAEVDGPYLDLESMKDAVQCSRLITRSAQMSAKH